MEQLKTTALSPAELKQLWRMNPFTKDRPVPPIRIYDELQSLPSIDRVFKGQNYCILYYPNFIDGNNSFGHYVAMVRPNRKSKTIYYTDPYGLTIDKAKKFAGGQRAAIYNETENRLPRLLLDGGYKADFNNVVLQGMPPIATCGRHALTRCMLNTLTNDQYASEIKKLAAQNGVDPDAVVVALFHDNDVLGSGFWDSVKNFSKKFISKVTEPFRVPLDQGQQNNPQAIW